MSCLVNLHYNTTKVVLQLMECLVLIYFLITISHLFVYLPNLQLTTFEKQVCSTKLGYANVISPGEAAT